MVNSVSLPFPLLCPNLQHSGLGVGLGALPWVGLPLPHKPASQPLTSPNSKRDKVREKSELMNSQEPPQLLGFGLVLYALKHL